MDGAVLLDLASRRGRVLFARAGTLLHAPDTDFDMPDALLMLTDLARSGRLSNVEEGRLKAWLRQNGSPFLRQHREACWGTITPPRDHFWWHRTEPEPE